MKALASEDAAVVVSRALGKREAADRPLFLRELLAHAAAALVVIMDEREAAESLYRLADAVVARKTRHG